MTLCYLAHPISEYGTAKQRKAIAMITRAGWNVLNPDTVTHQIGYKAAGARGMDYFVNLVKKCDALAFMPFPDGRIGAGVGKEMETAFDMGIPVYEIDNGVLIPMNKMPKNILSVEETRERIKKFR